MLQDDMGHGVDYMVIGGKAMGNCADCVRVMYK